jgi:hypothetical protein
MDERRCDVTKKLTIAEAEAQGFIVDTCCYPPVAYKGARFFPSEMRLCFTDLEAELTRQRDELAAALEAVVAVADRETDEFIRARGLIAEIKGGR